MSLLDAWADEPEDDEPSLMEEAFKFAPAPWQPEHVEPEGLSVLPLDFPVPDPAPRRETTQLVLNEMAVRAVCSRRPCALDNRRTLIEETAQIIAEGILQIQSAVSALYAHGEQMAAEAILERMVGLAEDIMQPLCQSVGMDEEE